MYKTYTPCSNCPNRKMCNQCQFAILQNNYQRALTKIIELSPKPITLLK